MKLLDKLNKVKGINSKTPITTENPRLRAVLYYSMGSQEGLIESNDRRYKMVSKNILSGIITNINYTWYLVSNSFGY